MAVLKKTLKKTLGDGEVFTATAEITVIGKQRPYLSLTGKRVTARGYVRACGRLHEEIAEHFPQWAHAIPFHMCSADGPTYYVENTVYHAGDRDHNGKKAGEPWAWDYAIRFDGNPVNRVVEQRFWTFLKECAGANFVVVECLHSTREFAPRYTFGGYATAWHSCPFRTQADAEAFRVAMMYHAPEFVTVPVHFSDGKARDLDAARRSAIWPDATDADLCQEPEALKAALLARLPALLAEFKAVVESLGLDYPA